MHSRIDAMGRLFSKVICQMSPQVALMNKCVATLVAITSFSREWLFKCVLKVPAWIDVNSHWSHLFDYFLKWVFKRWLKPLAKTNIKSPWLHLRNFSPEWFSNVPSNPLLEQMNNYPGCICMVFLLCQFSNASSDRQPKQGHNSICLDHHGIPDICPLWYTATLFRSVKSTLKSALIRNKIA